MHACPDCGQICEEDDFDDDYDLDVCVVCGSPNVTAECQECGGQLCHMHAETGAGFCRDCPTLRYKMEHSYVPRLSS